jgi:hypothetical protein
MRTGTKLASTLFVLILLFGFASVAQAQDRDKSWEVDRYGDDVELTYRDDGYDDVTIRDHGYGYNDNGGDYGYRRPQVTIRYEDGGRYGGYNGGYNGGYERRDYRYQRYERPRHRHHRRYYQRGW